MSRRPPLSFGFHGNWWNVTHFSLIVTAIMPYWGIHITLHTVNFDWFLSGLEWILNVAFCLLKLLIFYQKLLWNIRSRLNSSIFWVFRPVFWYVWSKLKLFPQKMKILIKTYLNTGSKTQNAKKLSLDLIFYNNFW